MDPRKSLDQTPLIEQLTHILAKLESEFKTLLRDMAALEDPRFANLEMVAEKIDFAAYCISTAKRVLSDERVAVLLDETNTPRARQ